jgi:hypothetical protein
MTPRHRLAVLLLASALLAPSPARAEIIYEFAVTGSSPTVGQSPTFQVASGGTLSLDVFLVEYNVTQQTSRLYNDGGLFSAGVRVDFSGGAQTASVTTANNILGNPNYDPSNFNSDITGATAGLNEGANTSPQSISATPGSYNGKNTYSVDLGTFVFSASSSPTAVGTVTNLFAERFDTSAQPIDYTSTAGGSTLDSSTLLGYASIKITNVTVQTIPEPPSIALAMLAAAGMVLARLASARHRARAA